MSTVVVRRGLGGNVGRLVVLLAGLALLTVLVVDHRPWDRLLAAGPSVGIVVDGQRFQVDAGSAERMGQRAVERTEAGISEASDAAARLVANELDALFSTMSSGLEDYADWYFSLRGEYTRLALLVLRWGGLTSGDPVADRALEQVLGGAALAERLTALERKVDRMLAAHAQALHSRWLEDLLTFARQTEADSGARMSETVLLLDDLALEFAGHGSSEFLNRLSASSAGAASAGVAAPLVARLALRSSVTAAGSGALALKGAGRGAAKAGSAGAAALGCAATGPAAWACALAVGGAAWLTADWALLAVDEARNRDALLTEWDARLALLRLELETALLAHYAQAIEAWHQGLRLEVERTFSPLDSLRAAAGTWEK